MPEIWEIAIDAGGTFTDCLAKNPFGERVRLKILSSGVLRFDVKHISGNQIHVDVPKEFATYDFTNFLIKNENIGVFIKSNPDFGHFLTEKPLLVVGDSIELTTGMEAPALACYLLTNTPLGCVLPKLNLRLGSTRGTNALLELTEQKPLLIVTKGFRDLLRIGTQQRPNLFALNVIKNAVMHGEVIEVEEQISSTGKIIKSLSDAVLKKLRLSINELSPSAVTVALKNAYINSSHEKQITNICKKNGVKFVSASAELSSDMGYVYRSETAVVNAFLQPVMETYLSSIKKDIQGNRLDIMQSGGGLVASDHFHPKDGLLSGPAGGMRGALATCESLGIRNAVTLDMGGTSTDVGRIEGGLQYCFQTSIGSATVQSPTIEIETVAAGGGSICSLSNGKLKVGPESGGANPGPACYGNNGPLCLTDVHLLLGRLQSDLFGIPVSMKAAKECLKKVLPKDQQIESENLLNGFLDIANENIANAIRQISIQKGHATKGNALIAFGGAGGLHACEVADLLGIEKVVLPFDAGILSASGIHEAELEQFVSKPVYKNIIEITNWKNRFETLEEEAKKELISQGASANDCTVYKRIVMARFKGQQEELELNYSDGVDLALLFKESYRKRFGYWVSDGTIECVSVRLNAKEKRTKPPQLVIEDGESKVDLHNKIVRTFSQGQWKEFPVWSYSDIPSKEVIGPALLISQTSSAVVPEGWTYSAVEGVGVILNRIDNQPLDGLISISQEKSIALELFSNRFMSIAEEMGERLRAASFSVNVRDRLDFSCALLDANGFLVANAPHIPVHLGALSQCVRQVIEVINLKPGEVVITNHPGFGGSHLPDVTLITAVFHEGEKIAYMANRAHHAEIGGKQPGSMPVDAKTLIEEGVVLEPMLAVREGVFLEEKLRTYLSKAIYPSRSIDSNIADIKAGLASLEIGKNRLLDLVNKEGASKVADFMTEVLSFSRGLLKKEIQFHFKEQKSAIEKLDDGSKIEVSITVEGERLVVDFHGTSPMHNGNLNANPAIVGSAVIYVLRLLVKGSIPLNDGLIRDVDIVIPKGSFLNPVFTKDPWACPAVVGGNVETSQRVVDTLLKAIGIVGCSQGTMNNFLFGDKNFGYYETICGGTGAGEGFNGADAVHQHMTNTRITDPEVLEANYPVRLSRFETRHNSGGRGKWSGGNGVIREVQFCTPLSITLLAEHRVESPYGMKGGHNGAIGQQYLLKKDGKKITLSGKEQLQVVEGDSLVIMTPGGGGYGEKL